jgi:hypothetical protein
VRFFIRPNLRGAGVTIAAAITLFAIACGGSGTALDADDISCDSFEGVESYRFSLALKLDAPSFDEGDSPLDDAGPLLDPLSAFADALTSLFSDMQLQGAYSAPDRTQLILDFEGEELEWRSIGDRTWVRLGDDWEEQSGAGDNALLTPEVVCHDIVLDIASSLSDSGVETETVNGIDTFHYSVDVAELEELPPLLLGPDAGDLPDDLTFDVWLAKEGLWPVQLSFAASDTDATGQSVALSLDMAVRDVNDPGILIEPPTGD